MADIGTQIQTRRKTLGFSQGELAKRLGVTTAYISKIESGSTPPSDELCKKIVAVLELDELATRSLRASALQERTGIKVEDIYPHVQTTGKKELRTTYEVTLLEAIRSLDDRQRSEILDWILLLNRRNKSKSIEQQRHELKGEIVDTDFPSSYRRGIRVEGLDDVLVRLALCCHPLPGEQIVGFITRGRGVTVHTMGCPTVLESDPQRRVDVSWEESGKRAVKIDRAERQTLAKLRAKQDEAIQMHPKPVGQKSVDKSSKKSRSDT